MRRVFCMLLICLLLLGNGAVAEETTAPGPIMAGYDSMTYRDWINNQFFVRMEEKTGIHFVYHQYREEGEWTKVKSEMTAEGEKPDVLFKARLSTAECIEMREKGVLMDLKPLLEANCPNLWAILQEHPDYMEAITLPDGSIAALPYIVETPLQNYIWINREWLSQTRLPMPTTAQELVQVLTAFRDQDLNRNGKKDEIPMGFLGPFDLKFLAHAFGMIGNDYNIYVDEGKVKFMPLDENYRLFVTWCRDLFKEGLLDPEGFNTNDSLRKVDDEKSQPTYGSILIPQPNSLFRVPWSAEYSILPPLQYEGKQIYRKYNGNVIRGTFALTNTCKEPEKMLQWVDYLYSEEGGVLATVGKQDVDYLVDGDNTWRFTDSAKFNMTMYSASTLISGGDATNPGISADAFQRRTGIDPNVRRIMEEMDAVESSLVMPFPYCPLSQKQVDFIAPLQKEIGYYVDMTLAQWVLGEKEISDESFAAFEKTLEEMGLPTFLAFWQDVLDSL